MCVCARAKENVNILVCCYALLCCGHVGVMWDPCWVYVKLGAKMEGSVLIEVSLGVVLGLCWACVGKKLLGVCKAILVQVGLLLLELWNKSVVIYIYIYWGHVGLVWVLCRSIWASWCKNNQKYQKYTSLDPLTKTLPPALSSPVACCCGSLVNLLPASFFDSCCGTSSY